MIIITFITRYVNHIYCNNGVTPVPPSLNNYGFPEHFNDNARHYHQYHGNNITPGAPYPELHSLTLRGAHTQGNNNHFGNNILGNNASNLEINQYRTPYETSASSRPYIQPNIIRNDYAPGTRLPLSSPNDRTNVNHHGTNLYANNDDGQSGNNHENPALRRGRRRRRPYIEPNIIHNENENAPLINPSITSSMEAVLSSGFISPIDGPNDDNEHNNNNSNDNFSNINDNNPKYVVIDQELTFEQLRRLFLDLPCFLMLQILIPYRYELLLNAYDVVSFFLPFVNNLFLLYPSLLHRHVSDLLHHLYILVFVFNCIHPLLKNNQLYTKNPGHS